MISEQSQYWAPVVLAKELIDQGTIGNVVSVRAKYTQGGTSNMWAAVLDGAGGQGDEKGVVKDESGAAKPWRYDLRLTGGGVTIDGKCSRSLCVASFEASKRSCTGGAHWLRPMRMLT